jgi:3D (Asp-Asp-Asp) domain-containing protein
MNPGLDDPHLDRQENQARGLKPMVGLWLFVLAFDFLLFPIPVLAENARNNALKAELLSAKEQAKLIGEEKQERTGNLPQTPNLEVAHSGYFVMTAYTSEVAQTDSSPCITANGFNVCEHGIEDTVATNYLPFGTRVRIPELFGERVFVVRDRMNARYYRKFDIWMKDKAEAIQFGVRVAEIEVLREL